MYSKYLLFFTILILFTIMLLYNTTFIENFDISPSNSYKVKENILDIHENIEQSRNLYIQKLTREWKNNTFNMVNIKSYAKEFVLRNLLEKVIKDGLNKKFIDEKIIVSEIESIGWYNNLDEIIFNFEINIINRDKMWIIPVNTWVIFNTKNLCNNNTNCLDLIMQQLKENLLTINDIDKYFQIGFISYTDENKYNVKPNEYLPEYFQIKNKLHLTEPFLTSREEMGIKNVVKNTNVIKKL